jgi:hypothetical protein
MSDSAALPSFKRPPVNEVVLSVAFDRPSQFSTAHIGNFWHTRLRKELPEVEEQPAYNRPIETDGSTGPRSCRDSQDAPKPGTKSHTGVTRPDRSRNKWTSKRSSCSLPKPTPRKWFGTSTRSKGPHSRPRPGGSCCPQASTFSKPPTPTSDASSKRRLATARHLLRDGQKRR